MLDTNVFHLKVMEHTIGKSLFEMCVNLHLIINILREIHLAISDRAGRLSELFTEWEII